ncbi:MAG: D-lyxose/D-mannose family sugar isomerase [Phycisphaerae bacterium]|nr:D-lyxose/D-mannose family sugar isomerase [Phycisphaerae bacterium]
MKKQPMEQAREATRHILGEAGIVLAPAHEIKMMDFGKGDFRNLGLAVIIRVSEVEYASKWLVLFPGQTCPNHYHEKINETFFIMKGAVTMWANGEQTQMKAGDQITMKPGTWHKFTSRDGAVIEEVTNRQYPDDSIFEDRSIERYSIVEDEKPSA